MYAIVETGGKQYRVKAGDTIAVERLNGEPGDVLDLGRVLLVAGNGDGETRVGTPGIDGAVVRAEVVEQGRGEKIIVFRYKSKVRYRRKTGHRQSLTRVKITDILLDGQSAARQERASQPAPDPAEPAPVAAADSAPVAVAEPEPVAVAEAAPEPVTQTEPETLAEAAPTSTSATPPEAVSTAEMPASAAEAGPPPETTQEPEAEA
jgi:large subunit ribosomal protein L21